MERPIIIVELCQNHKGNRSLMQEMIHAAKESGATYAKAQTIFSSDLVKRQRFEEGVTNADGTTGTIKRPYDPEFARLNPMDLAEEDYAWFVEECNRAGIKPLTTIFSRNRIPAMTKLPWIEVKVASYDCGSHPMISELVNHFSHPFISTGASYDDEIRKTAEIVKASGKTFSFLHCVTIYPTPLDQLHLNRMEWLRQFTPSVGFSDHTLVARDGIKGAMAALAMGADVVERHFTILPSDQTKDGPVSINPALLKELSDFAALSKEERLAYVKANIPEFEQMLGQPTRELSAAELLNRDYYRGRFAHKREDGKVLWNWSDEWSDADSKN